MCDCRCFWVSWSKPDLKAWSSSARSDGAEFDCLNACNALSFVSSESSYSHSEFSLY